jgi:hypothetical protein
MHTLSIALVPEDVSSIVDGEASLSEEVTAAKEGKGNFTVAASGGLIVFRVTPNVQGQGVTIALEAGAFLGREIGNHSGVQGGTFRLEIKGTKATLTLFSDGSISFGPEDYHGRHTGLEGEYEGDWS